MVVAGAAKIAAALPKAGAAVRGLNGQAPTGTDLSSHMQDALTLPSDREKPSEEGAVSLQRKPEILG